MPTFWLEKHFVTIGEACFASDAMLTCTGVMRRSCGGYGRSRRAPVQLRIIGIEGQQANASGLVG